MVALASPIPEWIVADLGKVSFVTVVKSAKCSKESSKKSLQGGILYCMHSSSDVAVARCSNNVMLCNMLGKYA